MFSGRNSALPFGPGDNLKPLLKCSDPFHKQSLSLHRLFRFLF